MYMHRPPPPRKKKLDSKGYSQQQATPSKRRSRFQMPVLGLLHCSGGKSSGPQSRMLLVLL